MREAIKTHSIWSQTSLWTTFIELKMQELETLDVYTLVHDFVQLMISLDLDSNMISELVGEVVIEHHLDELKLANVQ